MKVKKCSVCSKTMPGLTVLLDSKRGHVCGDCLGELAEAMQAAAAPLKETVDVMERFADKMPEPTKRPRKKGKSGK